MKRTWLIFLVLPLFCATAAADVAGKLISVQGTVEVQPAGQPRWVAGISNQILNAGDILRTGRQSRAVVLLADETQLKLNANTQLQLNAVRQTSNLLVRLALSGARADQSILNLATGEAWVRSKKTPASLSVKTPAVTAAIRGTEFDIRVAPDGESTAIVLEGSIDYRNDFGFVVVNPGEQGRARVGQAPNKTLILNPRDAVQWTLFYSGAVSPRDYPFVYASAAQAQSALRSVSTADPVALARLQHDAGDSAAAIMTLEGNTSAEASETRGWIFLEQNRIREAIQELNRVPAGSARARLGLSLAHYRLNEMAEAYRYVENPGADSVLKLQKAMLDLIAGDAQSSRALLETIAPVDPAYTLAQGLIANVNLTQNDKDKALAAAQRAVSANPASPSAYLNLSLVQQSFFDLPAATRSAEKALELDPDFLQAQIQYAKLLFGAGNSAKAEDVIRRALARAPQEAAVHSTLGFIQLGRGKTPDARASFETSLKLDSTRGEPHLGIGIANMREGQETDAVEEMLEAATLEPQIALYQSYLGKAFYEERKFEQAFSALSAAIDLDPRDPTPLLYSGIFQNDLNRPGEAVASYRASIRLNDNRAVYRSRFVLDKDLATRNVNLATAYNRLGLGELANAEALKSNAVDPGNSAARLFLAGTFLNLRGRTLAAGSELLMARLLLPVNSNSFNAFNDYTTLFELPRLNSSVEGHYGNFDTYGGTLVSSGGTRRFAFSSVATDNRSRGFRRNNDDSHNYTTVNLFKFALSPRSDLMLSYSFNETAEGDHGLSPVLADSSQTSAFVVSDANTSRDRIHLRTHRSEVGYHFAFSPASEFLLYVAARADEFVHDQPDAQRDSFGTVHTFRHSRRSIPELKFQAAHLVKFQSIRLRYGADVFEGNIRYRVFDRQRFAAGGGFEQFCERPLGNCKGLRPDLTVDDVVFRRKDRFKTVFLQSDYLFGSKLVLTGGLNYDWSNDDNIFLNDDERNSPIPTIPGGIFDRPISRWNPHGGILFAPFRSTTFRFAAMRVLQTYTGERLAPTHVNGFLFNQNEFGLTRSTGYSVGWDQSYQENSFLRVTAFTRKRVIPIYDFLPVTVAPGVTGLASLPTTFNGRIYGGSIVLNQFLTDRLAFIPQYSVERSLELLGLRHDHEGRLGLFYVHPRGYSFELHQNYLYQFGFSLASGRRGQPLATLRHFPGQVSAFTTDAAFSYEMPRKTGLISLRASNLFGRRYKFFADPLALDPRVPRRQVALLLRFNF
ncbi:MAG TPA: tetratricopeptide repeat protein [Acidobacteriota bacterium]